MAQQQAHHHQGVDDSVMAVLLAAGASSRYGGDKLLAGLTINGITAPLIGHTLTNWLTVFENVNVSECKCVCTYIILESDTIWNYETVRMQILCRHNLLACRSHHPHSLAVELNKEGYVQRRRRLGDAACQAPGLTAA